MFFGGSGFEGFGGMGGMGGQRQRGPINNERLYKLLCVDKSCSDAELKKAYRKLAMKHHPDKGGDTETFQEISHAFEVLSDPDKRKIYDEAGEEGLEAGGMNAHGDGMDIFDMFFGGGGRSRGPKGPPKTESVQTRMELTLEQVYKGATKQLAVQKDVICNTCEGHGGPKERVVTCDGCQGQGFKVKVVRMGPMISQSRSACEQCEQQGKYIPARWRCKGCAGSKVVKEKKVLSVHIEPGCQDGKRITFEGEADQRPNCEAGDVIVMISELEHPVFKRTKDDLSIKRDIDVTDLICGASFDLQALDGRKLLIKVPPGMIKSSNESMLMVPNEGMPRMGNPHIRGNLVIDFNIKFPTAAPDATAVKMLRESLVQVPGCKGLAAPRNKEDDDEVEIAHCKPFVARQGGSSNAYDQDDDEDMQGGHPQGVQCQTQ